MDILTVKNKIIFNKLLKKYKRVVVKIENNNFLNNNSTNIKFEKRINGMYKEQVNIELIEFREKIHSTYFIITDNFEKIPTWVLSRSVLIKI